MVIGKGYILYSLLRSMRIFIAVFPPKDILDYLVDLQRTFQKSLKNKGAKIRWTPKSRIHLTLKFLGEIDENKLGEVKKRLSGIDFKSFDVELGKVGFFPGNDEIKIVYVGLEPEEKIIRLQQKIDMELLDLFNKEQGFHGHVTLGRVKMIRDGKKIKWIINEKIEKKRMKIDNFLIMKSDLKKDGPSYSKLWERAFFL